MNFQDAVSISGVHMTKDGFLVTDAYAVRTGIQEYYGAELGHADANRVFRVYRSEDEVKDPKSLQSFSHAPITMGHPADGVSADNWKELAIGEVSTEATWDGNKIKLPLILKDGAAIKGIKDDNRELSAGYTCELDWTPGITNDGQPFDLEQKNIRINHVAVVPRGRAGSECRIGDTQSDNWGATPITTADKEITMTLRTIMVDGLSVQTTDAGAQAIEKLQNDLNDARTARAQADEAARVSIEAKDTEIGELKVENQKLKDAAPTAKDLDKMVADRTALIADVKKLDPKAEVAEVSDADLMKNAVKAKMGDAAIADASDAEIKGMFRALVSQSKDAAPASDPIARGLGNPAPTPAADEAKAYSAFLDDLNPVRPS